MKHILQFQKYEIHGTICLKLGLKAFYFSQLYVLI